MEARWYLRLSLFSFLSISLMGLLIRAKVVFEMPWVVQKHLQLGHAFFAFNGWVSFSLLWLMWRMMKQQFACRSKIMPRLILGQYCLSWVLFAVYLQHGMGYWSFLVEQLMFGWMLLLGGQFIYLVFTQTSNSLLRHWLLPAWIFNALGGVGLMYLAWHYMHRSLSLQNYLSGFYSYLHYQYNGWFLFAAMTLFTAGWAANKHSEQIKLVKALSFVALASVLLSLLWRPMPPWLYVIAIALAVTQIWLWRRWIQLHKLSLSKASKEIGTPINYLLWSAGLALLARMLFQLLSTIPALEQAAFSFRPIVIAYLHLILLGIFSSFLLYWFVKSHYLPVNRLVNTCIWLFLFAFAGTETVLAIQGGLSFSYTQLPYASEILLGFTALFPLSAGGLCWAAWLHKPPHREVG